VQTDIQLFPEKVLTNDQKCGIILSERKRENKQPSQKKIKKLFKNPLTSASKYDIIYTEKEKERIQQ
jgi:hypothetical protein